MLRLGIPVDRIAKRINISQKTVVESSEIIQSVQHVGKKKRKKGTSMILCFSLKFSEFCR